jgi:hypothetical protein
MAEQRRFPWLAVILGIGCVGLICIGVLVIGGGAALFLVPRTTSYVDSISPGRGLTGDQRLDDYSLFDDFSSEALGWPNYDDGKTLLAYENGAYAFQITEPEYYDWAFFPADFIPYEIRFDVQASLEAPDGTAGVFCHFQDEDNYYYAEFDLAEGFYLIGQIVNGDDIHLTTAGSGGQGWVWTRALNPPNAVNHIGVSCYLDEIMLFINDQQVDQVRVQHPFERPGEAALFVYAYDTAGVNGNKVFFDNVEDWQPVQ